MLKKILNSATLMSYASYISRFGSLIFVLPLILKFFSQEEQNVYFFLQGTFITFAILADSGFGSVLTRGVSYFKAGANYLPRTKKEFEQNVALKQEKPNVEMLSKLFSTSNTIYTILVVLVIILVSSGGIAAIWNIMDRAGHRKDLWLAYCVVGIYCALLINNIRWQKTVQGLGFVAKEARFSTLVSSIRVIIFIILLIQGVKPYVLFLFFLVEAVVLYFYLRSIVKKWFRDNNVIIVNNWAFDRDVFKSLWVASWKVGGIQWGNWLVERGNSIIVAQIPNSTIMNAFFITERLLDVITSLSRITFTSNIPTVYNLAAKKDFKALKQKTSGYMLLGLLIISFGSLFLLLFGNQFLRLISEDKHLVTFWILLIMCLTQLLDLHSLYHASIYTSTNHIPFLWPTLISGAIIVSVGSYILPIYGIIGIILVRFLVQISFNNWYAMTLSLKLQKWPIYKYIYQMPVYGVESIIKSIKYLVKK